MRILAVDDEHEMTALLARGLASDGHHVIEAHDGIDALSIAHSDAVDVAIVDVMLPGMSGFEFEPPAEGSEPRHRGDPADRPQRHRRPGAGP